MQNETTTTTTITQKTTAPISRSSFPSSCSNEADCDNANVTRNGDGNGMCNSTSADFPFNFCSFHTEMHYTKEHSDSHVIARGEYKSFQFLVVNVGGHNPSGYVNVDTTSLNGKHFYDIDGIDCHGGLTFSEDIMYITGERGWWIGWDYAHLGDHDPRLYDEYEGNCYTTGMVIRECLSVIDQIVALEDNIYVEN